MEEIITYIQQVRIYPEKSTKIVRGLKAHSSCKNGIADQECFTRQDPKMPYQEYY